SSYLVICAAAASTGALIPLVSVQMYPAAVLLVLLWVVAAILCVIRSLDQAANARFAATVLVAWFATTPVAWFFVRFPLEKSIVTYERLVFALVGLLAVGRWFLGKSDVAAPGPGRLERSGEGVRAASASSLTQTLSRLNRITKFEIVWSLLTLLACISALAVSGSTGYAFRTAID